METWIKQSLPLSAEGHILLETFPNGATIICPVATFVEMTASITTIPPTHAALSALPIAGKGGWQKYFDEWKTKGIIT